LYARQALRPNSIARRGEFLNNLPPETEARPRPVGFDMTCQWRTGRKAQEQQSSTANIPPRLTEELMDIVRGAEALTDAGQE
jgi:hypothetical protein